jgi:hypothetical protein
MQTIPRDDDRKRTATEWSAAVVARARKLRPAPRYGSPEWCALPTSDPRWAAAVALAAESWRDHTDPATVRRDLELELMASRQVDNRRAAKDFAELARGVRALSMVPTQEVLQARHLAVVS